MRKTLLAAALGAALSAGNTAFGAGIPVIDAAAIFRLVQQAEILQQQLTQLEATVHSLTNVPQDLIQQVEGLLASGVQNPLGQITQNLQGLLSGQGVGTCGGAQGILIQNQYAGAVGGDFQGNWLNQSANRNAGLQACTMQMLQATQARLQQMPQLLTELQGAHDVTQVTAVAARIQYENSVIAAQQQQAATMYYAAQTQRWQAEDQQVQKMRADAQERIADTSAQAGGGGAVAAAIPAPQPFAAQ